MQRLVQDVFAQINDGSRKCKCLVGGCIGQFAQTAEKNAKSHSSLTLIGPSTAVNAGRSGEAEDEDTDIKLIDQLA